MINETAMVEGRSSDALRSAPLRIGIATRSLFDLEEEHAVFVDQGVGGYSRLQREREHVSIAKGVGFALVARLLDLNPTDGPPYVEAVLLSRNAPDASLRAFGAVAEHGLAISTGSFTGGMPLAPFLPAWGIDLFLSNDPGDVVAAAMAGVASARLGGRPPHPSGSRGDDVRIAFDGDAVLFGPESDDLFKRSGLDAFSEHERAHASVPMAPGPFGNVLRKLSALRRIHRDGRGGSRVTIAVVTARGCPALARVVRTLRAWGTPPDQAHFVGSRPKAPILAALGADIFFDDVEGHVLAAASVVPAGHVPDVRTKPDAHADGTTDPDTGA